MGTGGVNYKVGDSADLDLVSVGQALVLVQIVGINYLFQSLCVIQLPHVSELHDVFSVVPLGKGLALLGIHCGVVYQEVILFGDSCIEYPRPARKSFGIGRNIFGTFGRYAEERILAKEGSYVSQYIHQYCGGRNSDVKPLLSWIGLRRFDKCGLFLRITKVPSQAIFVSDVGVLRSGGGAGGSIVGRHYFD